jgi:hypothetical protein
MAHRIQEPIYMLTDKARYLEGHIIGLVGTLKEPSEMLPLKEIDANL